MEFPMHAQVDCSDGVYGESAYVLINPVTEQVTHLVVRANSAPKTEYIVPVNLFSPTIAGAIQLHCTKAELEEMEPFIKTSYIAEKVPDYAESKNRGNFVDWYYYYPYVSPEKTIYETVKEPQIPTGEIALSRGTNVEAADGPIGKVDELVFNAEKGQITHLVMREGHLWGQKDVIIPLSAVDTAHDNTVFLKLNKHQIEALPTFPLHRRWS